jgi:hypothetical protein
MLLLREPAYAHPPRVGSNPAPNQFSFLLHSTNMPTDFCEQLKDFRDRMCNSKPAFRAKAPEAEQGHRRYQLPHRLSGAP